MKKKIRRLQLQRETLRALTPGHLDAAAGRGWGTLNNDTRYNSCPPIPISECPTCGVDYTCLPSVCNSCFPLC